MENFSYFRFVFIGLVFFTSLILAFPQFVIAETTTIIEVSEEEKKEKKKKKNFFNQRYRGWLWFDERDVSLEEEQKNNNTPVPTTEEMELAEKENKEFARELELLKQMMVRYPENLDYVVMYKKKEKEMQERAMKVAVHWSMANFMNPDLIDELENPMNMYGRDIKRSEDKRKESERLKKVAREVDLFIFRQGGCPYCETLEKHLSTFAHRYGFSVEAVSPDGSNSSYFETNHSPEMIAALGLEVMPTVVAIVKDTRDRYELVRGAVSIADLEEKSLLLEQAIREKITPQK